MERSDRLEQLDLELEAQSYLKYAIELVKARQELQENFAVIHQHYCQMSINWHLKFIQRQLNKIINMRKNTILCYLMNPKKSWCFTNGYFIIHLKSVERSQSNDFQWIIFTKNDIQNSSFLKLHMQSYQKCLITSLEVATKNDVNAVFIDEGTIVTKLLYNPVAHEFKEKIIISLSKEEKDKLIISDEKNVVYGSIYITDTTSQKNIYKLIEQLGFYFFQKPSSIQMQNGQASENIKKKNEAFKKSESFMQEQNELDILSKYEAIVPELTHDNIAILINLFNDQRVLSINHNYLAIQDISIIKNIDEIINKFQININYINQQNDRIWQQHINM